MSRSHSALPSLRGAELSRLQGPWVYKKRHTDVSKTKEDRENATVELCVVVLEVCVFVTPESG